MIKMAVFDLDGTLVNSLTDLAVSVNYALNKAGLKQWGVESYKAFVGNGRDMLIKRAMGDYCDNKELFDFVLKEYDKHYMEHCNDNTTPYDGCVNLLNKLSKNDIKTAVLSNKPDVFVKPILDKLYPNHCFEYAWGHKSEYKNKPEPDALNAILALQGINNDECIYVGDSDVDVYTAKNANVKIAGVSWGFRGKEELINAGAEFVADTADELYEYICKLNE